MVDGGGLTLVGSNQQLLLSAMFTSKYQVSNIHECNIHHINVYIVKDFYKNFRLPIFTYGTGKTVQATLSCDR